MHAFYIALLDLMYSHCRKLFTSKFHASATRSSPTRFHYSTHLLKVVPPQVFGLNWILTEVYDGNGSFYAAHRDNEHHVHKGDGRPWVSCLNVFPTIDGSEILRSPVEVGSLSYYLQGFWAPSQVVGLGISEPSTVCFLLDLPCVLDPQTPSPATT